MNLILLILFLLCCNSLQTGDLDLSNSKIWGPGLLPHKITLPARYLFLQVYDGNIKLNKSLKYSIEFKVTGQTINDNRSCRVWCNVLNRQDGSYILRYKLYESCTNIQIIIKYHDKHLGQSPYIIDEPIHPEMCVCRKDDIKSWLDIAKCDEVPRQIKTDLSHFKSIDWDIIRKNVIKKYDNPGAISLCHYVIKSNEVYRKCYGQYVGFKMFMDSILLSLLRKMQIPDLEFFVNLGDWPLVKDKALLYPIFSWCGSKDSYDIIMPTYDITESTIENMGRVMLDMLSVQGNTELPWEQRIPKLFWRGRDSNKQRLKLIDMSRKRPDLFNVSLTNFFFFRDLEEEYGPKSEHVSFYKFFEYKYQLGIDGTVSAYRFPYLLAGGSLVFKQESKYYEHFYSDLIAGEHYIPIENDLDDLVEKLVWAIGDDDEAKRISKNAQDFANRNLLPINIYCYHAHLFNEFSKLIESEVMVLDGMEKVDQPADAFKCNCDDRFKDEL